ncbi:MAG: hypothetical protein Q7J16_00690 [Candidatus Cloacimonadales bacterium]|nr:hypothetical protein [Candidatus Cloacimonadales bacterium]
MKSRKWLLIIVSIVMIVNISFFFIIRLSIVNDLVEKKLSKYISENLQAEVRFGNFTFNDKQLRITDLQVSSQGSFSLAVKQIYIEYNLPQLLLSNFKYLQAIKHIKIFEPTIDYNINPGSGEKKEGEKARIPNIAEFFKKLDIYDGKLKIVYNSEQFKAEKELHNLNLSIINSNDTKLTLNCKGTKSDSIFIEALLFEGELKEAAVKLTDFDLENIELRNVHDFAASLDFALSYKFKKIEYNGAVKQIQVAAFDRVGTARSLEFSGNESDFFCRFQDFVLDGNKLSLEAEIEKIFTDQRKLSATIEAEQIPIHKYTDQVDGFADLKVKVKGSFNDLMISAEAHSDSLFSQNQKISNVEISAKMQKNKLTFSLLNAIWEDNTITGSGAYQLGKELKIDLQSPGLSWQYGENKIKGDLTGNINYKDKLTAVLELQNCEFNNPEFKISNLTLYASIDDKDFVANLLHTNKDLQVSCRGILNPPAIDAQIKFKRFDLGNFLNNSELPIISGNLDVTASESTIVLNSDMRAYDQNFGKLNGRLSTNFIADLANNKTALNMHTYNGKFNYETFDLNLIAEGTLDSIRTKQFTINKILNIDAWCKLKPELQYGVNLQGENIKVKDIAQYFMNYYAFSELQGNADIQMQYDSRNNGTMNGSINFEKFKTGSMTDFNGQLIITGTNNRLSVHDSYVNCLEDRIFDFSGEISLQPEFRIDASGMLVNASLKNIFPDSKLKGDISGSFNFNKNPHSQVLNAEIKAENLKSNDLKVDRINLRLTQEDSLLTIHELLMENAELFKINGSGSIGYNFLTSTIHPDSNTVNITFTGDLLEFVAEQSNAIKSGRSDCEFNLKFGMVESGIFIDECNFHLDKGKLNIKDQPIEIDKISLLFNIKNNLLSLDKFELKTDEGKLYIKNEITNSDLDFKLGSLNLGIFKIKTNSTGLTVYIPKYTPKNSFLNAVITGRNSDYLEVTGPFDDLKIYGDVTVSNGALIFPPNTDNLMNLFNVSKPVKKDDLEANPLPISFDILLHVGENVRYVTFPVNVKVNEEGYLHLKYMNGEFQKPEGLFSAEEGSVDMFGTTLILDYMQIQLNQFGSGVTVSGVFYKKAADGTLITLEIYNDNSGDSSFGNLKFTLASDDPTDLTTDILAKLRFNRTMDEISPAQKKTLLQDEVIQIAGLGIESAVIDPLISPVENTLRQLFRLDYFHLQTDLIQNLFASYSSENKSQYTITEEQSQVDRFTSEMFLNNLSVSAGKYLTRKLFFDYELRLEKQDEIVSKTNLGVYQDFKLRYDLPLKFKISYQYFILPFDEKNQHQIGLERSFKF